MRFLCLILMAVSFAAQHAVAKPTTVELRSAQGAVLSVGFYPETSLSFGERAVYSSLMRVWLSVPNVALKDIQIYRIHNCFQNDGLALDEYHYTDLLRPWGFASSSDLGFSNARQLMLGYDSSQFNIRCQTEFSFSIDGEWQIDPVSGTTLFLIQH